MPNKDLETLYAFVGEEENGSGEVGIKMIGYQFPEGLKIFSLVSGVRARIDTPTIRETLQVQADTFRKSIRLAVFKLEDVVLEIHPQPRAPNPDEN